jgi:DNA-binding response OmpR family regulator
MLPDISGLQVCRHLREETDVPVIMLTVRCKEAEIVEGFKQGADDYVVKPWTNRELLARIQALLRRTGRSPTETWQQCCWCGDVMVDLRRKEVSIEDRVIHVTPLEFRLLAYLAKRSGFVVPHGELIAQLWGAECAPDIMRLRWHVHNLRQKIEQRPANPQYLLGKRGIGYYCTS